VLVDTLQSSGGAVEIRGLLDADRSRWGQEVWGIRVLGGDELLPQLVKDGVDCFVVGVGSVGATRLRERLHQIGLSAGIKPLAVMHTRAVCSSRTSVGEGVQLLVNSVVNAGATLGVNVIVNSGAIVEHDCIVGDHVHLATGSRLAGAVRVGDRAHIGAGATVLQNVVIGEDAVVGAGAVVVKDVPPRTVVVGVPARFLRNV